MNTDLAKQIGLTENTEIFYCEYCGPLLYQNLNMFLETSKLLWMLNVKVITLTKSKAVFVANSICLCVCWGKGGDTLALCYKCGLCQCFT